MKGNTEDIDLLEAYLNGNLSEEQTKIVENRLISDIDFQSDFEDLKLLQKGIKLNTLNAKLAMLKEIETSEVSYKKSGSQLWKFLFILVFIVLTGYLIYNLSFNQKDQVPMEYKHLYAADFSEKLILHSTKRSVVQTDGISPEQRRAYETYSIGLFEDAIPLLENLWTEHRDTLALFYLGVSNVGIGKKEKGLQILQQNELKKYADQVNLFFKQNQNN
ncbi:MAG TPA: hypothetical protein PKD85_13590 [Saprospiraceae bacterium]|nr:hypothetical protein [Saprospiraceae bacterium]